MNWFLKCLRQYADFKGRARRKEFWMFVLFSIIVYIIAMILDNLLGLNFTSGCASAFGGAPVKLPYGYLYALAALALFIPGLAVSVRRLHDTGRSGWFYFIILIPLIGGLILLYFCISDSQEGTNKWGANPKAGEVHE